MIGDHLELFKTFLKLYKEYIQMLMLKFVFNKEKLNENIY